MRSLLLLVALLLPITTWAEERSISVTVGSVAPAFGPLTVLNPKESGQATVTFDGKPVRGTKATLISFFATWCPGCMNEAPVLAELQKAYGAKGLRILSLTIERDPSTHEKFKALLQRHGATYTAAFDENERVRRAYQGGKFSLPFLYLVGADGRIIATHEGFEPKTASQLKAEIERALQ